MDESHEINIELNRAKYMGLSGRNLTYSFRIYYDHFKSGDDYKEFDKYTLLQINFNNFHNPNGKSVNRYYMIDVDDIKNKLTNNYSIMNIDIANCFKVVYNKTNLGEISDLEVWGAILACENLEDIASILERRSLSMSNNEKEKFINNIKEASQDKDVQEAIKFEESIEDRFRRVENGIRRETTEEVTKEVIDNIIRAMLKKKMTYEDISDISGVSIDEIIALEKSNN